MQDRGREVSSHLTVDHLFARLDHLERAFAALQRAYVELQTTAREQHRTPLVEEVLTSSPVVERSVRVHEHVGGGQSLLA
jgi:hypothetical protein